MLSFPDEIAVNLLRAYRKAKVSELCDIRFTFSVCITNGAHMDEDRVNDQHCNIIFLVTSGMVNVIKGELQDGVR